MIHEWWGLNDWVKEQASDLAKHGYVVLAVDLYRGQVADDPDTAHQLSRGLPQDRGIRDLKAAESYLRSNKLRRPEPHWRHRLVHGRGLCTDLSRLRIRI